MSQDSSKGVELAADILFLLAVERDGLPIRQIAERVHGSKSTVHRILRALEKKNLVAINMVSKKYGLAHGITQLSFAVHTYRDLITTSSPHLRVLRNITEETVCLHVCVEGRRVCVYQLEGLGEIRWRAEIGKAYPLHAGAASRALMAYLSEAEIDAIIDNVGLARLTPNTITDPDELKVELRNIREQGFAASSGERVLGGTGIAAPIRDHTGTVIGSVSIYAATSRVTAAIVDRFISLIKDTAANISRELGFAAPLRETPDLNDGSA